MPANIALHLTIGRVQRPPAPAGECQVVRRTQIMRHTLEVWGKSYEVSVHQKSKTVWIASGDYEGEYLQTQGRSEAEAVGGWREAARYRGNL